jgi:LuxR family maltose regulon positive regulatory protein
MVRVTEQLSADYDLDIAGEQRAEYAGRPVALPAADRRASANVRRLQPERDARHDPLLTTKLYPPPAPADVVPRPRLAEQLADTFGSRLTLVSAPAGYGKTTLLSEWIARSGLPVAWLSLDEGDNDPTRFWSYAIAALLGVLPARTTTPAISDLHDLRPTPSESAITAIINAFAGAPQPVALVLDDYHLIDSEAVHRTVSFLLEHLPPQLRLIIASRTDPPLALARLRARGQLRELRAGDLRFTDAEADAFLNAVMGLNLEPEAVATLETRTEGWVAGLRLAAHALTRRDDSQDFIAAFGGSHRSVVDYLVDEVLSRQSARMQNFLLQTSILERLSGPLCDAVTGQLDSQQLLEALERANLFVVSLDEQREWYRYHHLFAEVLRDRLRQSRARPSAPELHERAARWYYGQGLVREALGHAFAGNDIDSATYLLLRYASPLLMRGEYATVLAWLDKIPPARLRCSSQLCRIKSWALIYSGHMRDVEPWLQYAALGCWTTTPDEIMGEIISLRSSAARLSGQGHAGVQLSLQALELLPAWNHQLRGITQINLAASYGLLDDLDAAETALDAADEHARVTGDPCIALIALTHRAFVQNHHGRLQEAERLYRAALQWAVADGGPPFPAAAYAYLGLGEIAHQRNELDAARRHLTDGITLGEGGRFNLAIASYMCLARVKQAQGDARGADEAIEQAQRMAADAGVPHMVGSVDARRVLTWLQQGKRAEATRWARQRPAEIPLSTAYLDDAQDITVARVWLMEGKLTQALALLERLVEVADAAGRVDRAIELLALQAAVCDGLGDDAAAQAALYRALALGEPGGYVRAVVDAGPGVVPVLRRVLDQEQRRRAAAPGGPTCAYLCMLLSAFEPPRERAPRVHAQRQQTVEAVLPGLQLSPREQEVLRCIADGASNQQIADDLYVTVGTVKRHLHNIFGKLDANSRTKAVARARELGLIEG